MVISGFHVLVVMKGQTLRVSLGGGRQTNLDYSDVSVHGNKMAHLEEFKELFST
jgi:hypothetical protein